MKLTGPDFFEWMGLRRARRGGLTHREHTYYDHGNPVPGWLIPDILDGLLKDGLLELGNPESGRQQVALTEAGLTHYRTLCKRQRRKDLVAPLPSTPKSPSTSPPPNSSESEIRAILIDAVREPGDADGLFLTMLNRFGEIGGVELELPPRTTPARAADLSS